MAIAASVCLPRARKRLNEFRVNRTGRPSTFSSSRSLSPAMTRTPVALTASCCALVRRETRAPASRANSVSLNSGRSFMPGGWGSLQGRGYAISGRRGVVRPHVLHIGGPDSMNPAHKALKRRSPGAGFGDRCAGASGLEPLPGRDRNDPYVTRMNPSRESHKRPARSFFSRAAIGPPGRRRVRPPRLRGRAGTAGSGRTDTRARSATRASGGSRRAAPARRPRLLSSPCAAPDVGFRVPCRPATCSLHPAVPEKQLRVREVR